MKILEKLKNLYEMAWNEDIPSPKSCELLGSPPIKTSNGFKLCQICGTYTIDSKGCQNLNHKNNLAKLLKDDKI